MNLLRQVTLDRSNRKKDRSVSLTFTTQLEQSTEQFMEVDRIDGQSGVLYFKPDGTLTQKEIDEIDNVDVEVEGKSKSQRLRNVLYIYREQNPQIEENFKVFYANEMEKIIQHYKDKLDA